MNEPTPADNAFTQGNKRSVLDDLKLQPWTPDRIIAFQGLAGVYPNIGKQGWRQYQETGVYPGATRDVILFVYLSTVEPENVEDATWKDAKEFGVNHNLHKPDGESFWQAYGRFIQVQNEISVSTTIPKPDNESDNDDDPKG